MPLQAAFVALLVGTGITNIVAFRARQKLRKQGAATIIEDHHGSRSTCPSAFSTGPDRDGDCECNSGLRCYHNGYEGCTDSYTWWTGLVSMRYFLSNCSECQCLAPANEFEYDCDGDGNEDCKSWSPTRARCNEEHKCSFQYKFGDILLGQSSCRCKPECRGSNMENCQPEVTDHDCDGDGEVDCGSWNYETASCANLESCRRDYQFGDVTYDQSCRCRPCGRAVTGGADGDRNLAPTPNSDKVGASGHWARWVNWADHIDTCAPWMMPTNDADLRKLLSYAASKGYVVRPGGAGHSSGALVNDGVDNRVMVVSLGAYRTSGEWEYSLNTAAKTLKVNAGWSQLDVYQRIRPEGFFFPTQTIGYVFQMAGVIANCVHGAGYRKSFVNSYVTKMRVMLHDGSIKIISDESELKYWRNSYGLLGLIIGIEMKLEERPQYQMYSKLRKMPWSRKNFWSFIFDDAEADLPASISGGQSSGGSQKSAAGEFWINVQPKGDATFWVMANKENGNATESGVASGVPSNVASNYQKMSDEAKMMKFQHNGRISFAESVRKEGAPPLYLDPFQIINVNRLVGTRLVPTLAKVIEPLSFASQTIRKLPNLVKDGRDATNDGFFLMAAPNSVFSTYFMKAEKAFEAMDFYRQAVHRRNGQANWFNASGFSWNQPAEFRFVQVTDGAVLQPVPPGLYLAAEVVSFPDSAATDQDWKLAFKEIEDHWINNLGGVPHLGKTFGYEEENGQIQPFSQKRVCKVYSSNQKRDFKAYQARMDPDGRFLYGLGEKLLRDC